MTYALSAQDTRFRDAVRDFLAKELPEDLRVAGRRCAGIFSDYAEGIRWHKILARRGWSVPHWPVEHGGTDWTPMQHYIFAAELAAADAPPLAPNSTRMVAPVILAFGTEEQKQQWLPAIRCGDDYWAQGYSEPQAGSDLASLQCRAVRDGDHYVINGTKIWTTHAHWSNRMFCLVRTASGLRPQQGISFLLFDLHLPGITIHPIISISGDHELNQVFFDDVRVPASALLGDENQGWTIAKYLLQHERGHAWAPLLRARMRRLHKMADTAFADSAPHDLARSDLARKLAEAECGIDAVEAMEMGAVQAQVQGRAPGISPSMGKVLGTELRQKMTELAIEIGGHMSYARPEFEALSQPADTLLEESMLGMSMYLNDRAASIYAGTNEIQRNIIATHLLANRGAA
jgi:alkylation response protein AidB-like acyl-CoA dehydrogenase